MACIPPTMASPGIFGWTVANDDTNVAAISAEMYSYQPINRVKIPPIHIIEWLACGHTWKAGIGGTPAAGGVGVFAMDDAAISTHTRMMSKKERIISLPMENTEADIGTTINNGLALSTPWSINHHIVPTTVMIHNAMLQFYLRALHMNIDYFWFITRTRANTYKSQSFIAIAPWYTLKFSKTIIVSPTHDSGAAHKSLFNSYSTRRLNLKCENRFIYRSHS